MTRYNPSAWALFSLPPVRDLEPHGRLGIEKRTRPGRSPDALLIQEATTSKGGGGNDTRSDCAGARKGRHPSPPIPPPSRNARLSECACATRGGSRSGGGEPCPLGERTAPHSPTQANAARARTSLTVPRARATAAAGGHARALEGGGDGGRATEPVHFC